MDIKRILEVARFNAFILSFLFAMITLGNTDDKYWWIWVPVGVLATYLSFKDGLDAHATIKEYNKDEGYR